MAQFKQHHDDRGGDYSAFSDAKIQTALVRATMAADKKYGRKWKGFQQSTTQGLNWPRLDAYTRDDIPLSGVPVPLARMICELALRAANLVILYPDPHLPYEDRKTVGVAVQSTGKGTGEITAKSVKIGPITTTKEYSDRGTREELPWFPEADLWARDLIKSSISRNLRRA